MVKIDTKSTVLDRPWNQMVSAIYQKYPNPHSKSARVSDIISRTVDDENRVHSERYSGAKFPVPSIIASTFYKFTGIRFPELAFSYEYSVLDRETKTLRQYSKNITMINFLNFIEMIDYSPTEDGKTLMKQTFNVRTSIHSWVDSWFESQFLGICFTNADDGIKGLHWVAEKLNSDAKGLVDLHQFREKLKIFYEDVVSEVKELNDIDISKKIEEGSGEISKKIEELYCETVETLEHARDAIEEVTSEASHRVRSISESAKA